jgi:hypothetical protein
MRTIEVEESPRRSLHGSWPLTFFERRDHFDRKRENTSYIDWLEDYNTESECEEDTSDESDNEEKRHAEKETKDAEVNFENLAEQKVWKEGNRAKSYGSKGKDDCYEELAAAEDSEFPSRRSIARIFMKGMIGDEHSLPYRDQVDVVAGFCDQADHTVLSREEALVAVLDDLKHGSGDATTYKHRQLHPCSLTRTQLQSELARQVSLFR